MKTQLTKLALVSSLSILVSGCATVFSGSTQGVNVKVVDAKSQETIDGVVCKVTDGDGAEYGLQSNPGIVNVKRGTGQLAVFCKKDKYKQLNTSVGDSFNAVSIVNVLFWPGFIVDGLSGAYKKHPSHYVVTMEPLA